jgi:hypothetical protein
LPDLHAAYIKERLFSRFRMSASSLREPLQGSQGSDLLSKLGVTFYSQTDYLTAPLSDRTSI